MRNLNLENDRIFEACVPRVPEWEHAAHSNSISFPYRLWRKNAIWAVIFLFENESFFAQICESKNSYFRFQNASKSMLQRMLQCENGLLQILKLCYNVCYSAKMVCYNFFQL